MHLANAIYGQYKIQLKQYFQMHFANPAFGLVTKHLNDTTFWLTQYLLGTLFLLQIWLNQHLAITTYSQ